MSPRTKQVNQRIRDERREQILKAARSIFARQGFAETKITDIAAAAGVSYGLIDHYFGKKEEIYVAVIEDALQGAIKLSEEGTHRPGSPWDRLEYICTQMLEGICEEPEYVLLVNQASNNEAISDATKAHFRAYINHNFDLLVELIRQGQDVGQIVAGDPIELVLVYSSIIQGLASLDPFNTFHQDVRTHFPSVNTVLRILKP
jgi:AcrR family transcriptional regulator